MAAALDAQAQETVEICNARGLHARASAKFVKLATSYASTVQVSRDGVSVDARSIMGLLMLGAGPGSTLTIAAAGPDAAEAVSALADLVRSRFEEDA